MAPAAPSRRRSQPTCARRQPLVDACRAATDYVHGALVARGPVRGRGQVAVLDHFWKRPTERRAGPRPGGVHGRALAIDRADLRRDPAPPVHRRVDRRHRSRASASSFYCRAGRALPARVRPRARDRRRTRAQGRLDRHARRARRAARFGSSARCTKASFASSGSRARPCSPPRSRRPTCAPTPTILLAVAYGAPFHEALAALLPCYWIYWEVGKAAYASGFAESAVRTAGSRPTAPTRIRHHRERGAGGDQRGGRRSRDVERKAMRRHFRTTSRYEWMFWDRGWRCEPWPV